MIYLGPNFTLDEFVVSQTAIRHSISNLPNAVATNNLRLLVSNVLQPMRNDLGPMRVTSGYRGFQLNRLVGGSRRSDHCWGRAADIVPLKASLKDVMFWLHKNADYKQAIYEFGSWIHISYQTDRNRRQNLEALKSKGKTLYRRWYNHGTAA